MRCEHGLTTATDAAAVMDGTWTWTNPGCSRGLDVGVDRLRTRILCERYASEPQLLQRPFQAMRGCRPHVAQLRRGYCAEIAWDLPPDAAGPGRGHGATIARLVAYIDVRGWCLTKIPAFPFPKAATDLVRLNVSKFAH